MASASGASSAVVLPTQSARVERSRSSPSRSKIVSVRADRYDFQLQGRRSSTLVIL
jgi:hypothetical protein